MLYEDIQMSGSLDVTGSFVVPIGATASAGEYTGSLVYDSTDKKLYVWTGSWAIIGAQSEPSDPVASADIEYLVIAGGGGGGRGSTAGSPANGGAGGAGGYLSSSLSSVESGSSFTVTVGAGGSGGSGNTNPGVQGSDSSIAGSGITTITAVGGGFGAQGTSGATAGDGGSGGGGSNAASSGGSSTAGQGFDGGAGISDVQGGGGGGASEAGNTDGDRQGGDGKASSITGTSVTRAGGGSGGNYNTSATAGGDGGGGASGAGSGNAQSGTTNTGGGGGGSGMNASGVCGNGGAGGSGVVILAYPTASISATGGVRTFFNDRVAHTFNSSGTFAVGGTKTYTHNTLDVFNDSSCIALYTLDGNANDESGNYNGTASNVTYSQGYINDGGVFNGSNSNITPSGFTSSQLGTNGEMSISWWMNTPINDATIAFICEGDADSEYMVHLGGANTRGMRIAFAAATTNVLDVTNAFTANTWQHFVAIMTPTGNKLYRDGSLVGSNTFSESGTPFSTFYIGSRRNTQYRFEGKLDQVRIFNKELSAAEVTTLYTE